MDKKQAHYRVWENSLDLEILIHGINETVMVNLPLESNVDIGEWGLEVVRGEEG